jgi:hypothetical protein
MGKRLLEVSTELFVEFLKGTGDARRTYSVVQALPNDARVVEERWLSDTKMGILLESSEWAGVDERYGSLPEPRAIVHYDTHPATWK